MVTQVNASSTNLYVTAPATSTVLVGLKDNVGVGDGVSGKNLSKSKSIPVLHVGVDGVGVGVTANLVNSKLTTSQVIDGVGDGYGT